MCMNLCDSRKNANLHLKCQDGKIVINLQLELDAHVNQPYHHQPSSSRHHVLDVLHVVLLLKLEKLNLIILLPLILCLLHQSGSPYSIRTSVYQTMVLHGYEPIERQVMWDGSTVVVWLMQIFCSSIPDRLCSNIQGEYCSLFSAMMSTILNYKYWNTICTKSG